VTDFAIGLAVGLAFGVGFAMFVIRQEAAHLERLARRAAFYEGVASTRVQVRGREAWEEAWPRNSSVTGINEQS
jgi:hypothetical protein